MRLFFMIAWIIGCVPTDFAHAFDFGPPSLSSSTARRVWRVQDGLPNQTVSAFAQTADGYLWIGTKGGLIHFDGARLVRFDHADVPEFDGSGINCLLAVRDGSLWIGTDGEGLYHYSHGRFNAVRTSDGRSDGFLRTIFQDSHGTVWAGGDQGLWRVENDRLQRVDGVGKVPSIFVRSIVQDASGNLWVGGTVLLRIDTSGDVLNVHFPGLPNGNLVTALAAQGDELWVGTLSGLHSYEPNGRLSAVGDPDWVIQALQTSSDGALWIGTLGSGLARYDHQNFQHARAPLELSSNTISAVSEDREHNIWVGTAGGMERLTASATTLFALPGATETQFETIYNDKDNSTWCAATHLYRIRGDRVERATIPGLPPNTRVRTLLRDRAGALWVGTDGDGIFRVHQKRTTHYTLRDGLVNTFARVLLEGRDGTMWVGTDGGLSHITPEGIRDYDTFHGLAYFSVTALLEDTSGSLWIGTSRGLSHLRANEFVNDPATLALRREKIWSLYQKHGGALWIGTSNGLYRYDGQQLERFTMAEGLPENVIYQVLMDRSGYLWLSSPDSVSRVSVQALLTHRSHNSQGPLSVTLYPVAQDFNSAVLYSGMQPAGFLDEHGDAWFPSNRGAVRITATRNTDSMARFPIVIDSISVDGQTRPLTDEVRIAPGTARIQVDFTAILLRSQQDMHYRYLLEGFDKTWNDASANHLASYTNLQPGTYRLVMQAYEASQPTAVAEASLGLIQEPHFYRRGWFALLCMAAVLLIFAALHRLRVRQVAKQFQAVLQERNRLAREMHDTLIQDCAGVSAVLEAVSKMDFEDKALCHELIDQARHQVTVTIDETRSAVWDLRHRSLRGDTVLIQTAVEELARNTQQRSSLAVSCATSGEVYPTPGHAAHEVIMILKEALANATRHARATQIRVRLRYDADTLSAEVEDDGVGFDHTSRLTELDPIHYGLRGMQERAERLGAEFSLETKLGAGTRVTVQLPRHSRAQRGSAAGEWNDPRES
jgi:ligand-binding sensor domain-containing protein/signal transduction histidine kinase